MRGVVPKVKKQMGLEKKMNRLLFSTMIPMACLMKFCSPFCQCYMVCKQNCLDKSVKISI